MNILSLEQAQNDPNLRAAWAGKLVFIWSHEHNAYWRAEGKGYTVRMTGGGPGVFDFNNAFERTRHCGPEKGVEFEEIKS